MKKLLILLISVFISGIATCPPLSGIILYLPKPLNPFEVLMTSVITIESGGYAYAYNPIEEARGILQIRPVRMDDYNRRTGKNYTYQDAYNPNISKEIWMYYASRFRHTEIDSICRDWNGWGRQSLEYVKKVKMQLQKI